MCEVSVQIADLIIYHEAPPIGSCFHCWSCSNGSVHVLTWFKPFIQTVTSHSWTKYQTLVFSVIWCVWTCAPCWYTCTGALCNFHHSDQLWNHGRHSPAMQYDTSCL